MWKQNIWKRIDREANKLNIKKNAIPVTYDKWSQQVQNNIREVEKISKQNIRKDIMFKKTEKQTENTTSKTENVYEKTVIIERIKLMKEHKTKELETNRS